MFEVGDLVRSVSWLLNSYPNSYSDTGIVLEVKNSLYFAGIPTYKIYWFKINSINYSLPGHLCLISEKVPNV